MEETPDPNIIVPAILVSLVLFAGVYVAYRSAAARKGTIVLPGGITYLGPSLTPTPHPDTNRSGTLSVAPGTSWTAYQGKKYPYTFSYPETLSLGVFPDDPYDAVTVFYGDTDANANIFFRVDDLTKLEKTQYENKPEDYARNWWKDYTWTGVSSVTAFTNTQGMSGYRAAYTDVTGNTPYDHVFFSVPGRPDLIIWMSGKLFTAQVFNRIVDSVTWNTR